MTVCIVEDNENAREALAGYLRLEEITVVECGTLAEGRSAIRVANPDLVILDVMLPDGDGFLFAKELRRSTDLPILFLTARDQESDRITGLELGADDYVVKPFSPREVVLRVLAILKRTGADGHDAGSSDPGGHPPSVYASGAERLVIDETAHRALVHDAPVSLTAAEWSILTYLAARAPQVFSRMQLLDNCLGSIAEGSERTIDTHVKNLRKKLGSDSWIETVRGFGYRFSGERAETHGDDSR